MENFIAKFQLNFIDDSRWRYIADGLGTTFSVTFFAAVLGVFLGFIIALIMHSERKPCQRGYRHDCFVR